MRVLHIDQDISVAADVELALSACEMRSFWASTGAEGIELAEVFSYDAILIEFDLPDMCGLDILRRLRAKRIATPSVILATRGAIEDKVAALDGGADDYLTKPFRIAELQARLRAVIRRSAGLPANRIMVDRLAIDLGARRCFVDDRPLAVTRTEFALLECLALRLGATLTKPALLDALYHGMDEPDVKIIDVFVCKLRAKLVAAGLPPTLLGTVWGQGYTLGGDAGASGARAAVRA